MLHLVPLRLLLTVYALIVMASYAGALKVGFVSNHTNLGIAAGIFKVATPVAIIAMLVGLIAWRFVPAFVQDMLFPYLGGHWTGEIEFEDAAGNHVKHPATLDAVHTPTQIRFVLSTKESSSETLMVHARKALPPSDIAKLVYIYEVERREGYAGAGDRYRGSAFVDVKTQPAKSMTGSYVAGKRSGTLRMTLKAATPRWKIWR